MPSLDNPRNGFDFERATVLSGRLAHGIIILAEPHNSNLGGHFPGVRSTDALRYSWLVQQLLRVRFDLRS